MNLSPSAPLNLSPLPFSGLFSQLRACAPLQHGVCWKTASPRELTAHLKDVVWGKVGGGQSASPSSPCFPKDTGM